MKFKEIKPGMVIHCPTEEDAKMLLEYFHEQGKCYNMQDECWKWISKDTCYGIDSAGDPLRTNIGYLMSDTEITEFSDLIEPDDSPINSPTDSPMAAVEVIAWLSVYDGSDAMCKVFGLADVGQVITKFKSDEIVQKIISYEATKKKPKPVEVEWAQLCRIIQIQDNSFKKAVYEEEVGYGKDIAVTPKGQVEDILKKYISKHEGRYIAVIEDVCRERLEDEV